MANSTRKLSEVFTDLRNHNFDLSAVVLLQPKLLHKPEINDRGMLRLTGFFPTQPERLNFDLMYQFVEGQWRLFGIAADTAHVSSAAPASVAPKKQSEAEPSRIAPAAAPPDRQPAVAVSKTPAPQVSEKDLPPPGCQRQGTAAGGWSVVCPGQA